MMRDLTPSLVLAAAVALVVLVVVATPPRRAWDWAPGAQPVATGRPLQIAPDPQVDPERLKDALSR